MADPHWTSYVGMVSGLIGAATGIAGGIMAYKSSREVNKIKSLDLRLELRKAVTDITTSYTNLNGLIDSANKSRISMAAATGRFHSGMMELWNNELETDKTTIAQIGETIPTDEEDYKDLNTAELEAKLVDVHRLQGEVTQLADKYHAAMDEDKRQGDHIREDMRARLNRPTPEK